MTDPQKKRQVQGEIHRLSVVACAAALALLACVSTAYCAANSAVQSAMDCIARSNSKIAALEQTKQGALRDLRNGVYCSVCQQTKSEIEARGENFYEHVRNVEGKVVPASQRQINAKAQEFDRQIVLVQGQRVECEHQLAQALADAQQQEAQRQLEAQQMQLQAVQRQQAREQAELNQRQAEARLNQARDQIRRNEESSRKIDEQLAAAAQRLQEMLQKKDQQQPDQQNPSGNEIEFPGPTRPSAEPAAEQTQEPNQPQATSNSQLDSLFGQQPPADGVADAQRDLDDFHARTMARLEQNQQFYAQHPGYTGPPPGEPVGSGADPELLDSLFGQQQTPDHAGDAQGDLDTFHAQAMQRLERNREFYAQHPGYTGPPPGDPVPTQANPQVADSIFPAPAPQPTGPPEEPGLVDENWIFDIPAMGVIAGVEAVGAETIATRTGAEIVADEATTVGVRSGVDAASSAAAQVLKFGENDLVYGPYSDGMVPELQKQAGGKLLSQLFPNGPGPKGWLQASVDAMENTVKAGNKIRFDLTSVDVPSALGAHGEWGPSVTSGELRYIRYNWNRFKDSVVFYRNGSVVNPPW